MGFRLFLGNLTISIQKSDELYEKLKDYNTKIAVPIYEETVEWAGSLNAKFQNNPRIFSKSLLLRDKGLMKRKAQLAGIRVGDFEEAKNKRGYQLFL